MNNFKKIWFMPHSDAKEVAEMSKEIDKFGYDYALLPFKSGLPDPILRSVFVFQNTKNLGCFVAIPGYAMTAEYLSMIYKSIEDTFPNRNFMLNIIDGGPQEDLSKFGINKDIDNIKEINKNFVKDLISKSNVGISFSGASEKTIENSKKYGKFQYVQLQDFYNLKDTEALKNNLIVRIIVCARETKNEALNIFEKEIKIMQDTVNFPQVVIERMKSNLIYGSYEDVKEAILFIKKSGASGIVVSGVIDDEPDRMSIHKVLSEI